MAEANAPLDVQCVRHSTIIPFQVLFERISKHHELVFPDYARVAQPVHPTLPPTALLCDITTYAGAVVGLTMDLPVVSVFPFTAHMSVGLQAMLPVVGLAFPRHMTLRARITNFPLKFALAANGVPPLRDDYDVAGMYGPTIAPIVWGLDIPQPQPYPWQDLPLVLAAFMDNCSQGVVYVNWGTISVPGPEVEDRLQDALAEVAPLCVV